MAEGRLRVAGACALAVLFACASEVPPIAPSAPASTDLAREPWPRFLEVASFPALNDVPFPTRGHLIKPSHAIVRVSPEARADYLALVTDTVLAEGSTLAMFHTSQDGNEKGLVYVMEKKGGSWTFVALDADGSPTSESVSGCALCHRGGVADQVFGLPRTLSGPKP
jgi:hypothetical protein